MAILTRFLLLIFLVILLTITPLLAQSDPITTAPARTLEGIATSPDGKPVARVTLYLFGLPPGQTDMITLGDQSTVVTDAHGRFTWSVPAALPPLSDYIGVRAIACYALAADRATERLRLAVRPNWHGTDATGAARNLLEQATRPCETKWLTPKTHPILSVVVPSTSTIKLLVRGPDGTPVRSRDIQVAPLGLTYDYMGAALDEAQTDTAGYLHLRCFPGSLRFQVFVPGLGFGSTGTFTAAAGQSAAPPMPPLAPFARLSGTVAPALAAPGAVVHLDSQYADGDVWYDPRAVVDSSGHWAMADVLPGANHLRLTGGRGESESVAVTAIPGGQVSGITIGPPTPSLSTDTRASNSPAATISVRGRVTKDGGQPAVGADVYAVCSPPLQAMSGRGSQKVLTGKTDAAGLYVIPGVPSGDGPSGTSVHLVVRQPGFGLAAADGQSEKGPVSGRWEDIKQDIILPATHAALTVQVLQDGKPCPNVPVSLAVHSERPMLFGLFGESDGSEAAQILHKMQSPSGQTGPDGVVRFTDLTPGLWDITANRLPYFNLTETPAPPFNTSQGVAVQAGKTQSYTLSLLPALSPVAFRILSPAGVPIPHGQHILALKSAQNPNYGNLTVTPDRAGNEVGQFFTPGLFEVTAHFGDGPLDLNALAGPYFEGSALVAVSAAIPSALPIPVTTHRVGPASIRVRLVDTHGKPLRGAVTVSNPFHSVLYAASAGTSGTVVFPDVPLNFSSYTVSAHITGRPDRVVLPQYNSPLPADAALLAGTGQPLPQSVRVHSGEQALVTFGPEPPGYVRLHLTGPFASAKTYYIEGRQTDDEAFTEAHFDPTLGEYLLGPLPAGPRTLHLFCYVSAPVDANLDAGEVSVTVKAGEVVSATLAPLNTAAQEALYSAPLSGTVFLADGKTPAWGARAALFIPQRLVPLRMARADTQGRLVLKDYWQGSVRSETAPPGNPTEPVVAAWLPGEAGAVIVPFHPGQELRLVLPASVTQLGRVTVGGQSVLGLPSQLRIRAAYLGKGRLNDVLSREATAQADGTFTLDGLTPGTYQVQAARDGLWLSPMQTLTVTADPLPPLALDIPPPGLPVMLHLVSPLGKALAGQTVTLDRPAGPLTDLLWPKTATTNAHGDLRLDGLEAGPHTISGTAFTVPPQTGKAARSPSVQTIVLIGPATRSQEKGAK